MIDEIDVTELIQKLVKIKQIMVKKHKSFLQILFQNKYEKEVDPDEKIFMAAFDIFLVLIELKLQHPFIKDLVNLTLNVDLIFEMHEIVRPEYTQSVKKKAREETEKVVKEKKKPFMEELVTRPSKRMIEKVKAKKGKFHNQVEAELNIEEEEKQTNRTDADELESDVSLLQDNTKKKKRKFRICCIPIKPSDGKCTKCFKFLFCCSTVARFLQRSSQYKIANLDTAKKKQIIAPSKSKSKSKRQNQEILQIYDQNDFMVTETLIYYLNNTGSVEILTPFGLMKIYFPIPSQCVQMSSTLATRIIDEMTETNPQEAIKYI